MGLSSRNMTVSFGSLNLATGSLPGQLPTIVPKSYVTPYQMSPGEDGPGLRSFYLGGVHISNSDLEITFYALTSDQVATLLGDYYNQASVKTFSMTDNVSSDTTAYKFIYQEDGCVPEIQPKENYHDEREVWKCACKIHILEQVS